jgi:hypothetical protein
MNTPPQRRICYINFASHLLNAFNPNMLHLGLPYRWTDADWFRFIDMIEGFGFNLFEFWLEPRLFCRAALTSDYGSEFTRQMQHVIDYAEGKGIGVIMLAGLATSGSDWRTLCPNLPEEWAEIQHLWDAWTQRFPSLAMVSIFPGDPGACSRNGCTAETYIDRSIDIAHLVKRNLPHASVEFGTWGPPYFGWGNLRIPAGWQGEFIAADQHTAWTFDKARADRSMAHLLARLPDFPTDTAISINMGFNSDGNPLGDEDARPWAREIARTHPITTWDFSLTEGENAIFPHYRFGRLFQRRKEERAAAPYSGGICFTMSPRLNQLSLYESAQSFVNPDADPAQLAGDFYERLFGPSARDLARLLPYFEIIPDWGHYSSLQVSREEYHRTMQEMVELLRVLEGQERGDVPFHPTPRAYREELLFFAQLFADLSAPAPDYDALHQRYWQHVYAIYNLLPRHVDPRPHAATQHLIDFFRAFGTPQTSMHR